MASEPNANFFHWMGDGNVGRSCCGVADTRPGVYAGVALFRLRGNAPEVCLAQPNGLGAITPMNFQGQRPDRLHASKRILIKRSDLRPSCSNFFNTQPVGLG